MIKLLTLLVLFYVTTSPSGIIFAGNGDTAKNLIYAEALGVGGYGSVNYERIVVNRVNLRIGLRVGIGTYKIYDYRERFNPDLIFPFSFNILIFAPHTIEVGVGNTFSSIVRANPDDLNPERMQRLSASFIVGYRYSRKKGGIVLGLGYMPVIEFYERFIHGGGISIGFAF